MSWINPISGEFDLIYGQDPIRFPTGQPGYRMGGMICWSMQDNVTSLGTTQGTAYPISAQATRITGGNGGVRLPATRNGQWFTITNDSSNPTPVYPGYGEQIDIGVVNAPIILNSSFTILLQTYSAGFLRTASLQEELGVVSSSLLTFSSPAGQVNNVLTPPSGFGSQTTRIDVQLLSGDAQWSGLFPGFDGQEVQIRNVPTNAAGTFLTLQSLNNLSSSVFQFSGAGDHLIMPGQVQSVMYYGGSINNWVFVA